MFGLLPIPILPHSRRPRNRQAFTRFQDYLGQECYLDQNNNGTWDSNEPSTLTLNDDPLTTDVNESGTWTLADVAPGDYWVREVCPSGYDFGSIGGSAGYFVTVAPRATTDGLNFANVLILPLIFGWKYNDLNGNGYRDRNCVQGSQPHLVLAVDLSDSTRNPFDGTPPGDVNNDGEVNTRLDGELAALIAVNQYLIAQGYGDSLRVSIVGFGQNALHADMDPLTAGVQLYTTPSADADGDGMSDVEQALRNMRRADYGIVPRTDYSVALSKVIDTFNAVGTAVGDGNMLFVSDGEPNDPNNYGGQVATLRSMQVNLTARGAGNNATLYTLQKIDSQAITFNSPEGLVATVPVLPWSASPGTGGGSADGLYVEPGLDGIRVYLDLDNNGRLDWADGNGNGMWDVGEGEPWTLSCEDDPGTSLDEMGYYTLTAPAEGCFIVREVVPDGWVQTAPTCDLQTDLVAYFPFSGGAADATSHVPPATVYGATLTTDRFGNVDSAYEFDGLDDYIRTAVDSNQLPLTVSVWFRADSTSGQHSIVDGELVNHAGHSLMVGYYDGDNTLDLMYHNGWYDSASVVTPGVWEQAVAVYTDTAASLYVNGQLVATVSHDLQAPDGLPFSIGRGDAGRWFDGAIDDVRFYDRALTAAEVANLYLQESRQSGLASAVPAAHYVHVAYGQALTDLNFGDRETPDSAVTAYAGRPYTVIAGQDITLVGWGDSTEPGPLQYEWDLDEDGEFDDAVGTAAAFPSAGLAIGSIRTVRLRVTDSSDAFAISETTVTVAPAVVYVDIHATGANTGTSWADAMTDLNAAITSALMGQNIHVADGTYKPTSVFDRSASFSLRDGVSILGGYAGFGAADPDARDVTLYPTILSGELGSPTDAGDNCLHVVTALGVGATAVLGGVTVRDGNANVGYPDDRGGGLYDYWSSLKLIDCTFTNNSAVYGGAIFADRSSPSLTECTFAANNAAVQGGAIYLSSALATMEDCAFTGNQAGYEGGALYALSSPDTIALRHCVFSDNTAGYSGGGVYAQSSSLAIEDGTALEGNTAGHHGGGAFLWDVGFEFDGLTVQDNEVTNWDGGGLALYGGSVGTVSGSYIEGNTAGRFGGGLSVEDSSVVTLADCEILGNVAAYEAGGVYGNTSTLTIQSGCVISGNTTANWGGGINLWDVDFAFTDLTLQGNQTTSYDGGGLAIRGGSEGTISDSLFEGNTAARYGGGIAMHDRSEAVLSRVDLDENEATTYGGGIYTNSSTLTVTDAGLGSNRSSGGGGMYLSNLSSVVIENCRIVGNVATSDGGGIRIQSSDAHLVGNLLQENVAETGTGGALYVFESPALLDGNRLLNNGAVGRGSAAFLWSCSPTFVNNTIYVDPGSAGANPTVSQVDVNFACAPLFLNNIIWGAGQAIRGGSNWRADVYACDLNQGAWIGSNGNISIEPGFVDVALGDLHLVADSPCVDAGHPAFRDADGSLSDMGAYGQAVPQADLTELYVDATNSAGPWLGTATSPYQRIWEAMLAAGDGATVHVLPGEYLENVVIRQDGLGLFGDVEFPQGVVIDPGHVASVVEMLMVEDVEIAGLTLTGGYGRQGGAIRMISAKAEVHDAVISGNEGHYNGGGISGWASSELAISNAIMSANRVSRSDADGGGIQFSGGVLNVSACLIVGNSARYGGGLNGTAALVLSSSAIAGNRAVYGGGINWSQNGSIVQNSTIAANMATDSGGGLRLGQPLALRNSIVWGNDAPSGAQVLLTGSGALAATYSDIQDAWAGTGNFQYDPLFVRSPSLGPDGTWGTNDDDWGDLHLLPFSPCVDAGDPAGDYSSQTDIDGQPRVAHGRVDVGADEALLAAIVRRYVFCNNSIMDGQTPGASPMDDRAIDPTVQPLMAGDTTGGNCSGYSKGINGIMVDIASLAHCGELNLETLGDYFAFQAGITGDPSAWNAAPAPLAVDVRPVGASSRVTIIWADNTIQSRWLRVTVKSGAATGLVADDVFYFASLPGDGTGDGEVTGADLAKLATDWGRVRPISGDANADHVVNGADLAALATDWGKTGSSPADFNEDGQVNGADLAALATDWGRTDWSAADSNRDCYVTGADLSTIAINWGAQLPLTVFEAQPLAGPEQAPAMLAVAESPLVSAGSKAGNASAPLEVSVAWDTHQDAQLPANALVFGPGDHTLRSPVSHWSRAVSVPVPPSPDVSVWRAFRSVSGRSARRLGPTRVDLFSSVPHLSAPAVPRGVAVAVTDIEPEDLLARLSPF